jgi:hypothetical protein
VLIFKCWTCFACAAEAPLVKCSIICVCYCIWFARIRLRIFHLSLLNKVYLSVVTCSWHIFVLLWYPGHAGLREWVGKSFSTSILWKSSWKHVCGGGGVGVALMLFLPYKRSVRASGVAQVVVCLLSKHEALGSNPTTANKQKVL